MTEKENKIILSDGSSFIIHDDYEGDRPYWHDAYPKYYKISHFDASGNCVADKWSLGLPFHTVKIAEEHIRKSMEQEIEWHEQSEKDRCDAYRANGEILEG